MKRQLLLLMGMLLTCTAQIQAKDTIYISQTDINTRLLIPGTHRWLVYFKMGIDSPRTMFNIWTRTIKPVTYQGRKAIEVAQVWEDKDSIMHTTTSVCDAHNFSTLYHDSWWKQRGRSTFDFLTGSMQVNEKNILWGDTSKAFKNMRAAFDSALLQYQLNWHLDLEVFPILPYEDKTTFMIRFYDPGSQKPQWVPYTVTGSALLEGTEAEKIDCWLLEHQSPNNKEVFWISKKTREVLKLEQQFGSRFRYKIKLPFSK